MGAFSADAGRVDAGMTFLEWLLIILLSIAIIMLVPVGASLIPWYRKWIARIDAKRLERWMPGRPTWRGWHRQHLAVLMYRDAIPAMRAWCEQHMPGRYRYRKEVYDARSTGPWHQPFIEFRTQEDLIHFRLMWSEELADLPVGAYPLPLAYLLLCDKTFWSFQAFMWSVNLLHAYLRPDDWIGIARWLGLK